MKMIKKAFIFFPAENVYRVVIRGENYLGEPVHMAVKSQPRYGFRTLREAKAFEVPAAEYMRAEAADGVPHVANRAEWCDVVTEGKASWIQAGKTRISVKG